MMTITRLAIFAGIGVAAFNADAGTLKKEVWEASGCGAKPVAPPLNYDSIPEMNDSVAAMNAWQQQAMAYFDCVVKEANADVKTIADTVKTQQNEHKEFVEKTNAEVADIQQRVFDEQAAKRLESQ